MGAGKVLGSRRRRCLKKQRAKKESVEEGFKISRMGANEIICDLFTSHKREGNKA